MIRAAGFLSTMLWLGTEEELVDAGKKDDMPALARNCGLYIDNVHAPYHNCNMLWSDISEERDLIRNEYAWAISYCSRHDIPVLVIHITRSTAPPAPSQSGLDVLRELLSMAEREDVTLAIENTGRPDYLDHVFAELTSPRLGFCYDSSHDFIYGKPVGSILERWGHLLSSTHFSDNDGLLDDHWLPGHGKIDWNRIGACFPSTRYSGSLSLEVVPKSPETISAEVFLQEAFERAISLQELLVTSSRTVKMG